MNPLDSTFDAAVVYQLNGAKQLYINHGNIKEGKFTVEMPATASAGMYRLMYDFERNGYVNFIYNKKNVEFTFDPSFPSGTTKFIDSDENDLYNSYVLESEKLLQTLDSLQLNYFNVKDASVKKELEKKYGKSLKSYHSLQEKSESKTKGFLANSFIKALQKYYSENLFETPQEYLNSTLTHYFDYINFNDEDLIKSTFLSERVIEYVFYLNASEDIEVQQKLYEKSINEVLPKIQNNNLKHDILQAILYTFAEEENTTLIDFVLDEYYKKLPADLQSKEMVDDLMNKVRLAVGKIAPDFSWVENGETKSLHALNSAEKYILVFWSTSCSHCLKEVPQLYEFIKDKPKIKVLAFALENDKEGYNYHTLNFVKWTNILGLGKWENETARLYEINATPFYFVLDKNKKILAKPEFFKDTKNYLETFASEDLKADPIKPEVVEKTLEHNVEKGDTLYSISKKYGISVTELKKLNNLTTNSLKIGQKLKIKN
ncbi:LysM peptidoglycan-binding domain-containing protein [Lutibacter sp. TH_r2]|uniref:LysM peptidoglycan-binding domain-containing protein n=1 Tax=Lutibacter sp. TH_r2 TaxID=3082083 RepID=UPI003985B703